MNPRDVPPPFDGTTSIDNALNKGAPLPLLDLGTLLAFLKLNEADAARLRELGASMRQCLGEYVDAFYDHLLSFEETARFLDDPAFVQRLKQIQEEHLLSMLEAKWDDDYARRRRRIGRAHAERGVKARFLLATYNLFVQQCVDRLIGDGDRNDARDTARFRSLLKSIFLDLCLTLDEYIRQYTRDMRQALDMYWNVNQELKQFAQFSSHDLKTPLATVANLCEEVQDAFGEEIPREALEMIESARQTVYRMSATIDELLSATISTEALEGDQKVAMAVPIGEAIERVRPALEEKGIQLTLVDQFPRVFGNKADLREVFYNLLSNSAKYIEETPGRIEIGVQLGPSECTLFVKDNSPGIPRDEQTQIFAPFRRLAMHQDRPGTGLGLYFAKLLVEKHGGRIWVESELGKGTCFFVRLRRAPWPEESSAR